MRDSLKSCRVAHSGCLRSWVSLLTALSWDTLKLANLPALDCVSSPPLPSGVGRPQGLQLSNHRGWVPSFFTAIPTSHLSIAFQDACYGIRTLVKHVLNQWSQQTCSWRPGWYKVGKMAKGGSWTPRAQGEWWWARGHLHCLQQQLLQSSNSLGPKSRPSGFSREARNSNCYVYFPNLEMLANTTKLNHL